MKITNRDVKIFILGFVTFFLVESIYNWESSVNDFKRGWNSAVSTSDSKIITAKNK